MTPKAKSWWTRAMRHMSTNGLHHLLRALLARDDRLVQGHGIIACVATVRAADAVAYPLWQDSVGIDADTLNRAMVGIYMRADDKEGNGGIAPDFLGWWDNTPRETAFEELAAEVAAELQRRNNRILTASAS